MHLFCWAWGEDAVLSFMFSRDDNVDFIVHGLEVSADAGREISAV